MNRDGLRVLVGSVALGVGALVAGRLWGDAAWRAAVVLGVVAVVIQLAAPRLARRAGSGPSLDTMGGYLIGTVLRLAAVALIALVAVVTRDRATGLGAAVGYLGTILPLLYVETRTER